MTKISQLSDIGASLAGGDEFVIRDVSDAVTPNKKVTSSGIIDYVIGTGSVTGFTKISAGAGPLSEVACTFSGSTGTITMGTASTGSPVERLRIDSSGRVGIGTSSPGATVDVSSTTGARIRSSYTNNSGGRDAGFEIYGDISGTFDVRSSLIYAGNSGVTSLTGALDLAINTNNSERLRIDSSGRVGIGTSSPSELLDVRGGSLVVGSHYVSTVNTNYRIRLESVGAANNNNYTGEIGLAGGGVEPGDTSMTFATRKWNGSDYVVTEKVRIDSSGRVGIGTSTPGANSALEVAGNQKYLSVITNAGGGGSVNPSNSAGLHFSWNRSNGDGESNIIYGIGAGSAPNLQFASWDGTTYTERMRITSSGDLCIGTTSSTYGERLAVTKSSGTAPVASFINTTSSGNQACLDTSLNSTANNTSSYHLRATTQAVSTWYLYGNGTSSFTSDARKKKNIETTRDGYLEDLSKLRVVKYNWFNQEDGDPKELGLIAQEVEQVFPGLVQEADKLEGDDFNCKVLKGSVLPFMLLKALQEATARIESLEAEVAILKES